MKKVYELDFRGRKLVVEHGELAKQAHGSILVRYGDTVILSTVVVSKTANVLSDFFPLMVLYQEKLYSVGKIPGGFIKREGRPTEAATLAARMIDRPMRPLFPENFRNEVQIVNTVLSVDPDNSPEMTAMFGSSLATSISKTSYSIFSTPTSAIISSSKAINSLIASCPNINAFNISSSDTSLCSTDLDKALRIKDKLEKYAAIDEIKERVVAKYEEENKDLEEDALRELLTKVKLILESVEYDLFRAIVVKEKVRADGRARRRFFRRSAGNAHKRTDLVDSLLPCGALYEIETYQKKYHGG